MEHLFEAESAILSAVQPRLAIFTTPTSLSVGEGKLKPTQRLTLTAKGRFLSTCLAFVFLFVLSMAAFVPVAKFSEVVVPDRITTISLDKLIEETDKAAGKVQTSADDEEPAAVDHTVGSCKSFLKENCNEWWQDGEWSQR